MISDKKILTENLEGVRQPGIFDGKVHVSLGHLLQ